MIDSHLVERFDRDVTGALRRKSAQEAKLIGVLRTLAPHCEELTTTTAHAVVVLAKRGAHGRALYLGGIRCLAALNDQRAIEPLCQALKTPDAGGLGSLSAAGLTRCSELSEELARVAGSRHPQLAFAAEVARVARGESDGRHVASIAPKIKESHRIALCSEVFVPLLWALSLPAAIGPALSVLRGAERHLGRWLVFAEIASRAGDQEPLVQAKTKVSEGGTSARSAWMFVAWALGRGTTEPPLSRPTVELVARLSDRPSADRDMTFLYRLAAAGAPRARIMLESLAKGPLLTDEALRAAQYLIQHYARTDLLERVLETAKTSKKDMQRGLAVAILWDLGEHGQAQALAQELSTSRQLSACGWAALVGVAAASEGDLQLVTEANYRRVQLGWIE